MADDNATAEQRDEDVDGDDGVVVRHREPAGFEQGSQTQPHVATSADPQLPATSAYKNTNGGNETGNAESDTVLRGKNGT